jgi:alpha-glucosidase
LELFDFYKKLVALRRSSAALREGGFQVLLVEENLLAYLRDAEQELVIVWGIAARNCVWRGNCSLSMELSPMG